MSDAELTHHRVNIDEHKLVVVRMSQCCKPVVAYLLLSHNHVNAVILV